MAYTLISDEIAQNLMEKFHSMPLYRLLELSKHGAFPGVYAVYVTGGTNIYSEIARFDRDIPLYVGKTGGAKLSERLAQHHVSIAATDLDPEDFRCRFLSMRGDDDATAAERILLSRLTPLWNVKVKGFGNKHQGTTRFSQLRSRWDTLHPGREWASNQQPRSDYVQIKESVRHHITQERRAQLLVD